MEKLKLTEAQKNNRDFLTNFQERTGCAIIPIETAIELYKQFKKKEYSARSKMRANHQTSNSPKILLSEFRSSPRPKKILCLIWRSTARPFLMTTILELTRSPRRRHITKLTIQIRKKFLLVCLPKRITMANSLSLFCHWGKRASIKR